MNTQSQHRVRSDAVATAGDRSVPVTLIMTQRERFSMTEESLESLYANTKCAFELILVDGGSPPRVAERFREAALRHGFRLVRQERYLTPNAARNIGLGHATTPYVVFIDNDLLFSPGWLEALLACAEETGAAAVAPLTFEGLPAESRIHHAGGSFTTADDPADFFDDASPLAKQYTGVMNGHHTPIDAYERELVRERTATCEFHCVLVRRDVFDVVGRLDESFLSSKEHLDFSMSLCEKKLELWFEPLARVTYVFPCRDRPLTPDDHRFFALRWSDVHGRKSVDRFISKWGLRARTDYVARACSEFRLRRMQGLLIPAIRRLPLIGRNRAATQLLSRCLSPLERLANRVLVARADAGSTSSRQGETVG